MELWEQSLEPWQPTTMSMTDTVELLYSAIEDAERVVYAMHKLRNNTEENWWYEQEGKPLGELLDTLMDLECSMQMENDDEEAKEESSKEWGF